MFSDKLKKKDEQTFQDVPVDGNGAYEWKKEINNINLSLTDIHIVNKYLVCEQIVMYEYKKENMPLDIGSRIVITGVIKEDNID